MSYFIHHTADVSSECNIGDETYIWNWAQVREGVSVGKRCALGKGVYIDSRVIIGNDVKIQNNASIFHGVTVEDGAFIGPHVCFTNDLYPRAINPDLSRKEPSDWRVTPTRVCFGASIGANSTIRCGVTIGKWAMIGAGSVVVEDVPDHGLVYGVPARLKGHVCECGVSIGFRKHCDQCGYSSDKII